MALELLTSCAMAIIFPAIVTIITTFVLDRCSPFFHKRKRQMELKSRSPIVSMKNYESFQAGDNMDPAYLVENTMPENERQRVMTSFRPYDGRAIQSPVFVIRVLNNTTHGITILNFYKDKDRKSFTMDSNWQSIGLYPEEQMCFIFKELSVDQMEISMEDSILTYERPTDENMFISPQVKQKNTKKKKRRNR